jgi:succinyl-CoA synthetase beta subunit
MNITGMLYGAKLLKLVEFPTAKVLGPEACEHSIKELIAKCGEVFVKPVFRGGVGKKGKAGLLGRAKDLKTALKEKERLYFAEHRHGNVVAKAEGVTFEGAVPADHEVYVSIADSTRYRAPTLTITHRGGMDIEELPKDQIAEIPFDPFTGLKSFIITNALGDLKAPKEIISPLAQNLPKLWDLFHHYGMTTLELNPIRMTPTDRGGLMPVACDFKCGFDRDDPRMKRLNLPNDLFALDYSDFEQEINQLRTYQGQSDVSVINANGTILAPTFGGGANSLVTEFLGDDAIISSDFGGNPPYEKMRQVMRICLKHWLKQSNVLFIIGGKANNTDIFVTFRAMADALREYFSQHGPTPVYVVIGRGGPNLSRGLLTFKDACESLGLPYRIFGFDSAMTDVVYHAQAADRWMKSGGREMLAKKLGIAA